WHSIVWNHPSRWHTFNLDNVTSKKALGSFRRFCKSYPQKLNNVKRVICVGFKQYVKMDDIVHNFTSLIQLDWRISNLKNMDKLATMTNLKKLKLEDCDFHVNTDGLSKLTNLTDFYCDILPNFHILICLQNLTNLRLYQDV